ncbi:MAG: hypothetical protein PHI32_10790 [Dysgonamonadaceae bacterium]|jgi:hypothetical protein|nr:hypothetical protein [Dysgonamonadaceae bacterium]
MKKVIIVLCFFSLPFAFVYSQTEAEMMTVQTEFESDCKAKLENIFKAYNFKKKYDIVEYIYKESKKRESILFSNYNYGCLSYFFELIRGFPYFEPNDSIPITKLGEPKKIEYMPEDEVNKYIEQLNYTPGEAYRSYYNYIRNIKLEKESYLRCIDMELAKDFDSEYTKDILRYEVIQAPPSLSHLPVITKLHFLKLFKEFILNDDEAILPNYFRALVYLDCGCKTPYFRESSLRY